MRERFAPSPTGYLHLGHAFSALTAWDAAQAGGAEFLLRIEDIDTTRARPEFEQAIYQDLNWLGLRWPKPVMRQSERNHAYQTALQQLMERGLCYPCYCTRRDINMALSAPQEGHSHQIGPDGVIYPGICKNRKAPKNDRGAAIRLDMAKAVKELPDEMLSYQELGENIGTPEFQCSGFLEQIGDIVLARRDIGTSYHLSVVIDDAAQGISHVTRGTDMASSTPIHVLLQRLLNLPTPAYRHHRLIRDKDGKRLAKRDDARAIRKYRSQGATPQDIREMVGL